MHLICLGFCWDSACCCITLCLRMTYWGSQWVMVSSTVSSPLHGLRSNRKSYSLLLPLWRLSTHTWWIEAPRPTRALETILFYTTGTSSPRCGTGPLELELTCCDYRVAVAGRITNQLRWSIDTHKVLSALRHSVDLTKAQLTLQLQPIAVSLLKNSSVNNSISLSQKSSNVYFCELFFNQSWSSLDVWELGDYYPRIEKPWRFVGKLSLALSCQLFYLFIFFSYNQVLAPVYDRHTTIVHGRGAHYARGKQIKGTRHIYTV